MESMHFKEKTEQCHKLLSSTDVIGTLRKIAERQQDDEIRALYRSESYKLSKEYCRFSVDSLKWHSMSSEERKKHVLPFRSYKLSLEDQFKKPKQSGRKPSDRTRKRKPEPEILIDRLEDREKKPEKKSR